MKLKFVAVVSFIVISLVFLTGCEEIDSLIGPGTETKNYIVVTVNADFCVYNDEDNSPCANEPIQVQIIKAGGKGIDEGGIY